MTLPSSHSILLQLALSGLVVHHLDVATLVTVFWMEALYCTVEEIFNCTVTCTCTLLMVVPAAEVRSKVIYIYI